MPRPPLGSTDYSRRLSGQPKQSSRLLKNWRIVGFALFDTNLTHSDVSVLYFVLQSINSLTGYAFPSMSKIADKVGISRCSVVRAIKKLVEHGYLERESGDRTNSNRYRTGKPTEYIELLEQRKESHLARLSNLLADAA